MPKLLITDDDLHLRKLVRTYAEVDGYACEEAENGFQALEKLQCRQFDLMILDIMMPGMDGFETMAELRKFSRMAVGAARKDVTDVYGEPKKTGRRPACLPCVGTRRGAGPLLRIGGGRGDCDFSGYRTDLGQWTDVGPEENQGICKNRTHGPRQPG